MAKPGGGLQTTLVAYSPSSSDSSSSRSCPPQSANSRARTAQAPIPHPLTMEGPSPSTLAAKTPPPSCLSNPPRAQTGQTPTGHAQKDAESKKAHSQLVPAKQTSTPRNIPASESVVLLVHPLSLNVKEAQLYQIFEDFGEVVDVEIPIDRMVNLPHYYGYVEFKNRADAEKALCYMNGGQIDGNVVKVKFYEPQPPHAPEGDAPEGDGHDDKGATGGDYDSQKRPRGRSQKRSSLNQQVESASCPSPKRRSRR